MALDKNSTKVIVIDPLGTLNVSTQIHGNPSKSFWGISVILNQPVLFLFTQHLAKDLIPQIIHICNTAEPVSSGGVNTSAARLDLMFYFELRYLICVWVNFWQAAFHSGT